MTGVQGILEAESASHGKTGKHVAHKNIVPRCVMCELVTSKCHIHRASYQICLLAVNPLHDDDESGEDRIRAIRAGGDARLSENPLYSTRGIGASCHL